MDKKLSTIFPFILIPVLIPIYQILDNFIFIKIFGCGCVPYAQTNMFHIPFNANHLRFTVFSTLTISLSIYSIFISKIFRKNFFKILYCIIVITFNLFLTLWVVKTFAWN